MSQFPLCGTCGVEIRGFDQHACDPARVAQSFTAVPIRRRTPAGSLNYLADLLERSAENDGQRDMEKTMTQVAFTLRVLAEGDEDD